MSLFSYEKLVRARCYLTLPLGCEWFSFLFYRIKIVSCLHYTIGSTVTCKVQFYKIKIWMIDAVGMRQQPKKNINILGRSLILSLLFMLSCSLFPLFHIFYSSSSRSRLGAYRAYVYNDIHLGWYVFGPKLSHKNYQKSVFTVALIFLFRCFQLVMRNYVTTT